MVGGKKTAFRKVKLDRKTFKHFYLRIVLSKNGSTLAKPETEICRYLFLICQKLLRLPILFDMAFLYFTLRSLRQ